MSLVNGWTAEIKRLQVENDELLEACKGMLRISDLWMPLTVTIEHKGEALALHAARDKMLKAITKAGEK